MMEEVLLTSLPALGKNNNFLVECYLEDSFPLLRSSQDGFSFLCIYIAFCLPLSSYSLAFSKFSYLAIYSRERNRNYSNRHVYTMIYILEHLHIKCLLHANRISDSEWSPNQQHQYLLKTSHKCKFLDPTPTLLNQKLWGGGHTFHV